ncbi:MAG: PilZ domain-containing protein [Candidatus Competibacteraceae bacterium]
MPELQDREQRQYHRIRYPLAERPTLVCETKTYAVIDISARGLLYLILPDEPHPKAHDIIRGIVRFRRGTQVNIEGTVVRVAHKEVALYFPNREIPFSILLNEQRYLHARYPMWS